MTGEAITALKRTRLTNDSQLSRTSEQAACDIAALAERYGSVLIIVNTKAVASEVFQPAGGYAPTCRICTSEHKYVPGPQAG